MNLSYLNISTGILCWMTEMSDSDLTSILSSENEGALAGLGIATAAIFLAGEMAGSGVLALAYSVVQIGSYFKFET